MSAYDTIVLNDRRFVLVPEAEFRRTTGRARPGTDGRPIDGAATPDADEDAMPPLPPADAKGNVPAIEYGRASVARSVIQDRVAAGLTRRELAVRAGVRLRTLELIERAEKLPGNRTFDKIDRTLNELARPRPAEAAEREKSAASPAPLRRKRAG